MMLRGLAKKVAVVTGGAGEIGMAVTTRLLSEGTSVVVVDSDEKSLDRLCAGFEGIPLLAVAADVSTPGGNEAWVEAALSRFGRIDLMHNNAGVEGRIAPIVDLELADLARVMNVNVQGAFLTLQAGLRVMQRQDGGGAIVNSASFAGIRGLRKLAPYVMSKHALIGLTRCAAIEGASFGVRCNAIAPGPIRTRMMRSIERGAAPDDPMLTRKRNLETIPMGRYGEPEEVAAVVTWLLSDEATYLNGAVINVDGARSA
jgi:NAD(P)-dependent dehydrogenase (short-subunit alcohol dehydrogenase family)